MSGLTKLYLSSVSMLTPLGDSVDTTAAAVQAGLNRYGESGFLNHNYEPMTLAAIPEDAIPPLSDELIPLGLTSRQRRLLRIAHGALTGIQDSLPEEELPLFLAGPETLYNRPTGIDGSFLKLLSAQSGIAYSDVNSRVFSMGRAGGAHAIEYAFKYMSSTGAGHCLIGGLDSFIDLYLLKLLDKDGRVKSHQSMDAFVPGEAAVFLLLSREKKQKENISIYWPGLADETGHRFSSEPYRGDGLSSAYKLALSQGGGKVVNTIYSSLNGENFGAREYGVANMRNSKWMADEINIEHPADCYGDIGAACIPAMIALAEKNKETSALIYGSSDGSARGVVQVGVEA